MKRLVAAGAVLVLTACGGHEVVQCGACPGPGYVLSGVPSHLRQPRLTSCVNGEPCRTVRSSETVSALSLQYLPLASDAGWADYDGRTVVVTLRDGTDRWQGTGTLHHEAPGGSPCACGGLSAEVALTPVTPGSPR